MLARKGLQIRAALGRGAYRRGCGSWSRGCDGEECGGEDVGKSEKGALVAVRGFRPLSTHTPVIK